MHWKLLIGAACAVTIQSAIADTTLDYAAPDFLEGPVVASSMLGTTYAYRARDVYDPTTLQITVVKLPKESLSAGEFSTEHCIQLFLTEVAKNQSKFFAVPVEKVLVAGELQLRQVRWTRKEASTGMTGVTSCGSCRPTLVVFH